MSKDVENNKICAGELIQSAIAEDFVPIVRCNDCIFRYTEDCAMQYKCECGLQVSRETGNDYCSWGEKRTNDEN